MEEDFRAERLHPSDLKPALNKALNVLIQPVRDHFKQNPAAAALLKRVQQFKTTR
jgi:tyrosyl-tRNA synthetase